MHDHYIPDIPADADNLTAALAYAEEKLYVLPVKRGTKNPGSIVGDDWPLKSSRDPETLTLWFRKTDHDIAIDMGRSGLVGIDMDHPELAPLWFNDELAKARAVTPYQSTRPDDGGRGHYVFTQPEGKRIGCATGRAMKDSGFEVRGDGGVIIVQPSSHRDGGRYQWERTGLIAALPAEIVKVLPEKQDRQSAATDAEVEAFFDAHTAAGDFPAAKDGWNAHWDKEIKKPKSRHVTMVDIVPWAMEEVRCGYVAGRDAADLLRKLFVEVKTREYNDTLPITEDAANVEFDGILAWGIAQASKHTIEQLRKRRPRKHLSRNDSTVCATTEYGIRKPGENTYTDSGNGANLVNKRHDNAQYAAALGKWVRWDNMSWRREADDGIAEYAARSLAAEQYIPEIDQALIDAVDAANDAADEGKEE